MYSILFFTDNTATASNNPKSITVSTAGHSTTVTTTTAGVTSSAVAVTITKLAATTTNDIFMSATTVCSNQVDATGKFSRTIVIE